MKGVLVDMDLKVQNKVVIMFMHLDVDTSLHHINIGKLMNDQNWNYFGCHKPCGD